MTVHFFKKRDKNYHKYINTLNRLKTNIEVVQGLAKMCKCFIFTKTNTDFTTPNYSKCYQIKFSLFSQISWLNINYKKMTWSEHILSTTNKTKTMNTCFKRLQVFYEKIYTFRYYHQGPSYLVNSLPNLELPDLKRVNISISFLYVRTIPSHVFTIFCEFME